MVTEIGNKGRVKSQASTASNDYFDEYFEQLTSQDYMRRFKGLTPSVNSSFGP